jgi:transposase-like protein
MSTIFQYKISAFVVDGSLQIASAIKSVYPQSLIQRCLVHIHRQIRAYLSHHPKHECGKELL